MSSNIVSTRKIVGYWPAKLLPIEQVLQFALSPGPHKSVDYFRTKPRDGR